MDFIKNFTKAIESLADFQPHMFNGATEKELFALEEKLGLTLPSDFKVFYQTYNGQDDCADYLFDFFSLCTLEKIAYCWEALKVNEADFLGIVLVCSASVILTSQATQQKHSIEFHFLQGRKG